MSYYTPGEPTQSRYRVVWYRVPDNLIGGPYAVAVMRPDGSHSGTRVSGIADAATAERRAWQYAEIFKTTDVREVSV